MSKLKNERKKEERHARRDLLLTLFEEKEGYEEKEFNGFQLIKHWNGGIKEWAVDVYSKESYENYKQSQRSYKLNQKNQTTLL